MESTISGSSAALQGEVAGDYTLSLIDSIENISTALWNEQIPPANLLMQYDYLKLIEDTQKSNLGFRYVWVKKDKAIQGVIYFQTILFTGADLLNYFPENPTGWKKFFLPVIKTIFRRILNFQASGLKYW